MLPMLLEIQKDHIKVLSILLRHYGTPQLLALTAASMAYSQLLTMVRNSSCKGTLPASREDDRRKHPDKMNQQII